MKYSREVKIEKIKETAGISSTKNPHSVSNVNQAQGPRTGNQGLTGAKRSEFKSAKAEREPLAATIMAAYGARTPDDHVNPKLEPIRSDVKPKKFSR